MAEEKKLLSEFTALELVDELLERDEGSAEQRFLKEIDSDDLIEALQNRGDMPDCQELHVDHASSQELLEALSMEDDEVLSQCAPKCETLLRHGIVDRDWKKIEEAATAMGVRWFRSADMKSSGKPPLPDEVLRDTHKRSADRQFPPAPLS